MKYIGDVNNLMIPYVEKKKIIMLSIPRDTRVIIEEKGRKIIFGVLRGLRALADLAVKFIMIWVNT